MRAAISARRLLAATLSALLLCVPASRGVAQNGSGPPQITCLSPVETRSQFMANRLVPPVRVMRQSALANNAEAIDIQMCRFNGTLVYDVTLLDTEGRVLHRLIGAFDGAPMGPRPGFPGGAPQGSGGFGNGGPYPGPGPYGGPPFGGGGPGGPGPGRVGPGFGGRPSGPGE